MLALALFAVVTSACAAAWPAQDRRAAERRGRAHLEWWAGQVEEVESYLAIDEEIAP